MNKSGGGKSSLGYLFGSDESGEQKGGRSKVISPPVCMPPYGTDDYVELNSPAKTPTYVEKYVYRGEGDHKTKSILVTGRPSTKVKSVPGGDSSLGYLFGDK
ncbi:protein SPIRAL1-like 5 [Rutidosis leptorrhynchoides]|uniref:protein SPIRAL1-like 5 n=1 Tax=Rutidosis leptorrhynchoides TaxID=125765 RepID=UPI003A994068